MGSKNDVRLNLRDSAAIRGFLERLDPRHRESVSSEALESIARLTEQRAKEVEIVRGRGRDPEIAPPLAKRLTFRSGRLSGSISTDATQLPRQVVVGTPVAYGPVHELGLGPFPKRAFLEPAADHVMETNARAVFEKALARARARA
jgi:phage gpG-like protein